MYNTKEGDLHGAGSRRGRPEEEMTMNALTTLYRNSACAAAAVVSAALAVKKV